MVRNVARTVTFSSTGRVSDVHAAQQSFELVQGEKDSNNSWLTPYRKPSQKLSKTSVFGQKSVYNIVKLAVLATICSSPIFCAKFALVTKTC